MKKSVKIFAGFIAVFLIAISFVGCEKAYDPYEELQTALEKSLSCESAQIDANLNGRITVSSFSFDLSTAAQAKFSRKTDPASFSVDVNTDFLGQSFHHQLNRIDGVYYADNNGDRHTFENNDESITAIIGALNFPEPVNLQKELFKSLTYSSSGDKNLISGTIDGAALTDNIKKQAASLLSGSDASEAGKIIDTLEMNDLELSVETDKNGYITNIMLSCNINALLPSSLLGALSGGNDLSVSFNPTLNASISGYNQTVLS